MAIEDALVLGQEMEKAGLEVHLPKVWAWFNARTMVMKVALMACPDIDGALVGGASLKADSFAAIVHAA